MAISITDIVSQMRASLAASEPDLDTSVGSVSRKMLDAVAEVIAEAQADRHLLTYTYDLDTKQGADLDAFTSLFGIQRFPAQRSTGTVTFARNTAADSDISIPIGTRVATSNSPEQRFATAVPSVLREGQTEVEVPVVAVDPGSLGNVPAGAITRRLSALGAIPTVYNSAATTNGRDAEDDQSLRSRFKQTVFRSMAGTEQMYRGVALDNPDVVRVNVIGTFKSLRLAVEVAAGTVTFTIPDAKYVYENTLVVGPDIDAGDVYVEGVNYTATYTPNGDAIDIQLTEVSGGSLPPGIYDVEVDYIPNASRNDPDGGVRNRVDLYCQGTTARTATETLWFRPSVVFVNDTNSPLHYENFIRPDGSNPAVGSYFVRYHFTPLIDGATGNVLTLDTVNTTAATFTEDTDFFAVRNITPEGGAFRSMEGIEVPVKGAGDDPVEQVFTVEHAYNAVPRDVQTAIEQWRLLSTDVLVHAARPIRLALRLVVVYNEGTDISAAEDDIFTAVGVEIDRVGFVNRLQTSDVLRAVAQVEGVDAVRFATSVDDGTEYAIQRLATDGTTVLETYADGSGRAIDVITDDDEVVTLDTITIDRRSRDSFATGQ